MPETAQRYRHRPSIVDARQLTAEATLDVIAWLPADRYLITDEAGMPALWVRTPVDGRQRVHLDDWIVHEHTGYRVFSPATFVQFFEEAKQVADDQASVRPVQDPELEPPEFWIAGRDTEGHIRLNGGQGLLVALAADTREGIQEWLDRTIDPRYRRQYTAALALLDAEEASHV